MTAQLGAYGLSLRLGGNRVLEDVSFELARGEIAALLGPNGSGKTSLLLACAGMIAPEEGQVRFGGKDLASLGARERARVIAYVSPEVSADFPITAFEAVMLGRIASGGGLWTLASARDSELVRQSMERCRCWELRDRELQSLSGGEKQLVTLAKALAREPRVLLLDETLSRMDLHHQAAIGAVLKELAQDGATIVLVAHDVNLATEWAESCILLKQGRRVAAGPVASVWTTEAVRSLYPAAGLSIAPSPVSGRAKVFFS
ncbi:MAG TPA: ABC transporter ATP-binding protein [Bdellovibrionota bacterium]|nr:ABC transporter ATP-binding protein [Bdellovibrionota bacterium]